MPNKLTVPWRGVDVLLFLALFFATLLFCGFVGGVAASIASRHQPQEQTVAVEEQTEGKHHGHLVLQLVKQSKESVIVLVFVFLSVVVVASLVEELVFRLFLQGWLEAKLSQFDIPHAAASGIAIVAVSLFFAALHGGNQEGVDVNVSFFTVATSAIVGPLVFALGIYYLMEMRNMKLTHCLFGTKRFSRRHLLMIAGCSLLALPLVYGIAYTVDGWYPDTNTDPIPLFFFSLVLGVLYSVTRNLSYCILLHACLNATTLTIAWFSTAGHIAMGL